MIRKSNTTHGRRIKIRSVIDGCKTNFSSTDGAAWVGEFPPIKGGKEGVTDTMAFTDSRVFGIG